MADDTSKRGPADGQRIDVSQKHELRYWTEALGVDAETLKATVNRVGPMVDKVRRELRSRQ
jgi:hypothetical protein